MHDHDEVEVERQDAAAPVPCKACRDAVLAVARVTPSGATAGWCKHMAGGVLIIASCANGRVVAWQYEAPVDRVRAARVLGQNCQTQDAIAEREAGVSMQ
ncbi:hypothetical protein [Cupriavidus pinatubonensis]|uniref:hypothetical protein n=1 Tax=Cupriavidus pinatubonensis TaxID=248026 RepID=UPI00112E943E|nr:hypothetical protein [Cupriavidus pinatubonensis]TPQ35712.1 hypothetical protein C2U69_20460 [Cupriavidus pinatubonensis]